MKLQKNMSWKKTSFLLKTLPIVPLLNDVIFEIWFLKDISVIFKVPVLSLFVITSFSIIGRTLEKKREKEKCFLGKDRPLKIIMLLISLFYMMIWGVRAEQIHHLFDFPIPYLPSPTILLYFLTTMIFSSLIGFYLYKKTGSVVVHLRILNSFSSSYEEDVTISEINAYSGTYKKAIVFGITMVGGFVISIVGILFGIILWILLTFHLALVIISLVWVGYDLIEKNQTNRFDMKSSLYSFINKFSKKKKLFFDFGIIKYGFDGLFKFLIIIIGIIILFVHFSFTLYYELVPSFMNHINNINSQIPSHFLLYYGGQIILILSILTIGFLIWFVLIKRAKYWLDPKKRKKDMIDRVQILPSHIVIFFPITWIISSILISVFNNRLTGIPLSLLATWITVFLGFYLLKEVLKTTKTKMSVRKEKIEYDNYRIIGLFYFVRIWSTISRNLPRFGTMGVGEIGIQMLSRLPLYILIGLFYFWREIMRGIKNLKISNGLIKKFIEDTYLTTIAIVSGYFILKEIRLGYIYLLPIFILGMILYLSSYFDL